MAEDARLGGGVSTRSDGNQARELGVCRHTIRRWKKQLECSGAIVRDGYHVWHARCKTVRYRIATQGCGEAKARPQRTLRCAQSSLRASALTGMRGRRRNMKNQLGLFSKGEIEKAPPYSAATSVAAVIDQCGKVGIPVAMQVRARLGSAAKQLVLADFPPDVIVSAMMAAVRTGMYGSVETIAQEMVVAMAGGRISRDQYRQALAEMSTSITHGQSPVWRTMREEMARRAERLGKPGDSNIGFGEVIDE